MSGPRSHGERVDGASIVGTAAGRPGWDETERPKVNGFSSLTSILTPCLFQGTKSPNSALLHLFLPTLGLVYQMPGLLAL